MGHWVSCHPECHWPPISGYKLLPLYFQLLAAGMAWGCTRSEEWNFYLPVHSNKNIFSKRVQEPDKAARCENQLVHVQPYKIEDTSTPRMSTGTRTISQDPFLLCCYMQIKNSPQIKMDTQQRHGQLAAGLVKTQTPCPSHQGHKHYTLETLRIRPFHNSWKDYEHYLPRPHSTHDHWWCSYPSREKSTLICFHLQNILFSKYHSPIHSAQSPQAWTWCETNITANCAQLRKMNDNTPD